MVYPQNIELAVKQSIGSKLDYLNDPQKQSDIKEIIAKAVAEAIRVYDQTMNL